MKRAAAVVGALALAVTTPGVFAQAKPSFAGKWTCIDCPAPGGGGGGRGGRGGGFGAGLGPAVTIEQTDATLTIIRAFGDQTQTQAYPIGGETKFEQPGRGGVMSTLTAKTAWDGEKLVITTTGLPQGGERRQVLSIEGSNLVVETTNPGRQGGPATTSKATYKKD